MKVVLLAALCLAPFVSCQDFNITDACFQQSFCTENIISTTNPPSKLECQDGCEADPSCNYYSWIESVQNLQNTCLYHSASSCSASQACDNCVSGPKTCDPSICHQTQACKGTVLAVLDVVDYTDCLLECYNNYADCQWITFYNEHTSCHLLSDCQVLEDEADVETGESTCALCPN